MTERNGGSRIPWVAIAFVFGLGPLILGGVTSSSRADLLGMVAMLGLALIFSSVTQSGKQSED